MIFDHFFPLFLCKRFQGKEKYLLVVDPSSQEESSMDGIISFSINSFRYEWIFFKI
jgi:exosome complex RNA-binding protein Rrp42 (RNase PH superfamily)